MKSTRVKEMLKVAGASVTMMAVFAITLLGINTFTLRAATEGETYLPPEIEDVSIPDSPAVLAAANPLNVTVSDITLFSDETSFSSVDAVDEVNPLAMPIDEAVAAVARYIYDIFGVCINGMYVEIGYTSPEWFTRSRWSGTVSSVNRRTLERLAEMDAWHNEARTRIDAGEHHEDVWMSMPEHLGFVNDTPAEFQFSIDAVTGERIDIWGIASNMRFTTNVEVDAINAFIQNEWGGDWDAALNVEVTPQLRAALYEIAERLGPKQFENTAVISIEFSGAHSNFYVDANGNIAVTAGTAGFAITDENGRVAVMVICIENMEVVSVHSSRNDMVMNDRIINIDYAGMRGPAEVAIDG